MCIFRLIMFLLFISTQYVAVAQEISINSFEDIQQRSFEYRPKLNAENIHFNIEKMSYDDFECYCVRAGKKSIYEFNVLTYQNLNDDNKQFLENIKKSCDIQPQFGVIEYKVPFSGLIKKYQGKGVEYAWKTFNYFILYKKEFENQAQTLASLPTSAVSTPLLRHILLGYKLEDIAEFYKKNSNYDVKEEVLYGTYVAQDLLNQPLLRQQILSFQSSYQDLIDRKTVLSEERSIFPIWKEITINSFDDINNKEFVYRAGINNDHIGYTSKTLSDLDIDCYSIRANKKPTMVLDNIEIEQMNEENKQFFEDVRNGKYADQYGIIEFQNALRSLIPITLIDGTEVMLDPFSNLKDYILFRKEFEHYAKMLSLLWGYQKSSNNILIGICLGYHMKDIQEFYHWNRLNFQADLQQALKMIDAFDFDIQAKQYIKSIIITN